MDPAGPSTGPHVNHIKPGESERRNRAWMQPRCSYGFLTFACIRPCMFAAATLSGALATLLLLAIRFDKSCSTRVRMKSKISHWMAFVLPRLGLSCSAAD